MSIIKLQSTDGDIFEVDVQIANYFGLIKTMIECLGVKDNEDPVLLPRIDSATLKLVIDWATFQHNNLLLPEDGNLPVWQLEFLNVNTETLLRLLVTANYLDLPSLMEAACRTVENMVIGKSPEQIRQIFNIKSDFPYEEAEGVQQKGHAENFEGDVL